MSERQMTIGLLIAMGVIVVFGLGGVYWLRYHWLAEAEAELVVYTQRVDEAQAKKAKIPTLEATIKRLSEQIERDRQQIPVFSPRDENDQFADLVDHLRKKCRVVLAGARWSAPRAPGPGEVGIPAGIFQARYEIKVGGGFYQILNYLNHLETDRRFLVADNIKIFAGNVAEKSGKAPVRELHLNLSTFLQRPAAAPPGPPGVPTATKPGDKPADAAPEEPRRVSTPIPD